MRSVPLESTPMPSRPACFLVAVALAIAFVATPTHALEAAKSSSAEPDPPKPTEIFRDEFLGATLAPHWQVARSDATAFEIGAGALRVESREPGGIFDADLTNRFQLSEPMPAGDWTVTAKLSFRLDTGSESFYLVLHEDAGGWYGAQIRSVPNKYTGHRLMLGAVEGRDGWMRAREQPLVAIECNICDSDWAWRGFSRRLIDDQTLLLRIEQRAGRHVISGRLGDGLRAEWVAIDATATPRTAGRLAFGLTQSRLPDLRQGAVPGGASSASIDWIAIEVPRDPALIASERPAIAQSVPTR